MAPRHKHLSLTEDLRGSRALPHPQPALTGQEDGHRSTWKQWRKGKSPPLPGTEPRLSSTGRYISVANSGSESLRRTRSQYQAAYSQACSGCGYSCPVLFYEDIIWVSPRSKSKAVPLGAWRGEVV